MRGGNSERRGLGGSFTLSDDGGDHRADADILAAIGNDDLPDMAFIGGLKLHRRLVGLDLGKDVARLPGAGHRHARSDQIGRASRRESGSQYVSISVVAVSFHKKNEQNETV